MNRRSFFSVVAALPAVAATGTAAHLGGPNFQPFCGTPVELPEGAERYSYAMATDHPVWRGYAERRGWRVADPQIAPRTWTWSGLPCVLYSKPKSAPA